MLFLLVMFLSTNINKALSTHTLPPIKNVGPPPKKQKQKNNNLGPQSLQKGKHNLKSNLLENNIQPNPHLHVKLNFSLRNQTKHYHAGSRWMFLFGATVKANVVNVVAKAIAVFNSPFPGDLHPNTSYLQP